MTTAHLIHGFIGSGKTTFAKALAESESSCIRFTHDEWMHRLYGVSPPPEKFDELFQRIDTLIWDTALELLSKGCPVILDSGFWTTASRTTAREQLAREGHESVFYDIQCDLLTMRNRTIARSQSPPPDSLWIDANAFETLYHQFEPMSSTEAKLDINGKADPIIELSRRR